MNYSCVNARFLFFDGVKRYTVEYYYGLSKWFVFNGEETSGCVYQKVDKKIIWGDVSYYKADEVLSEYLNQVETY